MKPRLKQLVEKHTEFLILRDRSRSADVPVNYSHSLSPTVRHAKGQAKMIHELEPNIKLEGHEPEPTPETHQPTRTPSLPAIPNDKQNSMMLDEFKAQDNSDSDPDPVVIRRRIPGSKSQRKARMLNDRRHKRPPSKPKSSSRRAPRASGLLREIADYNKSPEAEDRHELAMAREFEHGLRQKPLTRETRKNLMHVAKNETPTARESLNLRKLFHDQFSGAGQSTKRLQPKGNSDLNRHKKQRKDSTGLFLGEEEDDGEETLANSTKTHERGHSQLTPMCQLSPRQVGKFAGSSQDDDESSAESVWSIWDSRKGQSKQA